jgi:hypothetical protein
MSEQKATPKNTRGTRRGTQAVAGVAGAATCLAIGWAVGARSAGTHATASRATTAPTLTQPTYPMIPGGDDDEDPGVQWGTVPVTGLTPAQPGTGIVPPSTGSGGSAVAATSVTTNAVAPTTTTVSSTTPTGATGVRP